MIRRSVTAIAAEDLARMIEADGLRCAARLLRMAYVGSHGALVADAMAEIIADIADSRPRGVGRGEDRREVYARAARAIRDGNGYTALGALAGLVGDEAATVYAERCAREQGVEASL